MLSEISMRQKDKYCMVSCVESENVGLSGMEANGNSKRLGRAVGRDLGDTTGVGTKV